MMWKWIGYGAAALVGIFVTKKLVDEYGGTVYERGYRLGRAGKAANAKFGCYYDTMPIDATPENREYCKGMFQGMADRKLAGEA